MFTVKIGPLSQLKEIDLEDDRCWTVRAVADRAGISLSQGQRIRIDKINATSDDLVTGPCVIHIGEALELPESEVDFVVRIGPLGNARRVVLDGTRSWTVEEVIAFAGLTIKKSHSILVDQQDIERNLKYPITESCKIVLVEPIKANGSDVAGS